MFYQVLSAQKRIVKQIKARASSQPPPDVIDPLSIVTVCLYLFYKIAPSKKTLEIGPRLRSHSLSRKILNSINSWHTFWCFQDDEILIWLRRHLVGLKMFKYDLEQYFSTATLLPEPSAIRCQGSWVHFPHSMNCSKQPFMIILAANNHRTLSSFDE